MTGRAKERKRFTWVTARNLNGPTSQFMLVSMEKIFSPGHKSAELKVQELPAHAGSAVFIAIGNILIGYRIYSKYQG